MTEPVVPDPVPPASPTTPTSPPDHRPRRWPWAVLGFLVTLLAIALAAPTLMSLAVARQYAVGRINRHLTSGHLEVGEWSLGWMGTEVRNVRLFDDQRSEVFSVVRLKSDLSFWDLIHGRYDLGETLIEEPNFMQLVVAPDGSNNLQAILPASVVSRRARRGATGNLKLRGNFTVERLRGTIVDRRDGSTTIVQPSDVTFKIHNVRDEVPYEVTLKTRIPTATSGDEVHRESTARVPVELATVSDDGLPIGPATLAGADALLRGIGRGPATQPAATQPAAAATQASATQAASPRHRSRGARHVR